MRLRHIVPTAAVAAAGMLLTAGGVAVATSGDRGPEQRQAGQRETTGGAEMRRMHREHMKDAEMRRMYRKQMKDAEMRRMHRAMMSMMRSTEGMGDSGSEEPKSTAAQPGSAS